MKAPAAIGGAAAGGVAAGISASSFFGIDFQPWADRLGVELGISGLILAAGAVLFAAAYAWERQRNASVTDGHLDASLAAALASEKTANAVASNASATKELRDTMALAVQRIEMFEDRIDDATRQAFRELVLPPIDSLGKQVEGIDRRLQTMERGHGLH